MTDSNVRQKSSFFEEVPAWNQPDLALAAIELDPPQVRPGEQLVCAVSVVNAGTGRSGGACVSYVLDGRTVGRVGVEPLEPGDCVETRVELGSDEPGVHRVRAELECDREWANADELDLRLDARFWVDGGERQPADVELELIDTRIVERSSAIFTFEVVNLGFGALDHIELVAALDGERIGGVALEDLRGAARQRVEIAVEHAPPGDHLLAILADWPDTVFDAVARRTLAWHVNVPGLLSLSDTGRWRSLGPRVLVKAQPDGSQGRVDHLVVDPHEPSTLYAGAVRGGLWKSLDGGDSWANLTDGLAKQYVVERRESPLHAGGVALDPDEPEIVYYGTGSSRYRGGVGIFKSIDGGISWHQIADHHVCQGVSNIHVARASDDSAIVYAATDMGLLRVLIADPWSVVVSPRDWTVLRSGRVEEMHVDADDPGIVYVAVIGMSSVAGLYRCHDADTAAGSPTWIDIGGGLPALAAISSIRLDVCAAEPTSLYASTTPTSAHAATSPRLSIYQSPDRGDTWQLRRSFGDGQPTSRSLYNPFLRVHPQNPNLVWFGGVNLFKLDLSRHRASPVQLWPPHDDHHEMTFDPTDPGRYYVTGDGGVWRLQVASDSAHSDPCVHRNADLRVLEFYDFDVAEGDPSLIVGGTQDNGTVVYTGSDDWNATYQPRGGDGGYSVINCSNHDVVLSQYQFLRDMLISVDGPEGPWIHDFVKGKGHPNDDLYVRKAYATFRPANPDVVATAGDEVWATTNARDFTVDGAGHRRSTAVWSGRGPSGATVTGSVTRVVFQPDTSDWYAGTSTGQIWRSPHGVQGTWSLADSRAFDEAAVIGMVFAPTNHDVLYVMYAGGDAYRRVQRLQGLSGGLTGTWMGDNLPANRELRSISGDGYDDRVVYVGTDKGVFEADLSRPGYDLWRPFNDGLPLVKINDLVVPTGRNQSASPSTDRAPERALFAATRGRGAWVVQTR